MADDAKESSASRLRDWKSALGGRIQRVKDKAGEKYSELKGSFEKFSKQHQETLNVVAKVLNIAAAVPGVGGVLGLFGDLFGYAAALGKEAQVQAALITEYLLMLGEDLERVKVLFQKYSDDQKLESQLDNVVDQTFKDLAEWKLAIDQSKMSADDLVKFLERRHGHLEKAIAVEALRWDVEIFNSMTELHKKVEVIDKKVTSLMRPDTIYVEAKQAMIDKHYEVAIEKFLDFRERVKLLGKDSCRAGSFENSAYYLYRCWEEDQKGPSVAGAIDLVSKKAPIQKNPYQDIYDEYLRHNKKS